MNGFTVMRSAAPLESVSAELGLVAGPFGSGPMARANTLVGGWMDDAGIEVRQDPAGGLSGGRWGYFPAEPVDGTRLGLDAIAVDKRLQCADVAVGGEGRLDTQTLTGKAVADVAGRCPAARRPLHVITESIALAPAESNGLLLASMGQPTTLADSSAPDASLR
jgi:hypothetical protein